MAEGRGGALVVDHGHLDAHGVATHAQADERDLDDGQQELEAQRAKRREGAGEGGRAAGVSGGRQRRSSALLTV